MKKLLMTLLVAVFTMTANAQFYVGGEAGFWRDFDANTTEFLIHPDFGYELNETWDLGMGIGFSHNYVDGTKVNAFQIDPYARWSYAKFGPVSFFLDMTAGINSYKVKDGGDAQVGWRAGVQPGLRINLAKNIDFIAHVGFLGYQDADDKFCSYGQDGFGFKLSGENLLFGINYKF